MKRKKMLIAVGVFLIVSVATPLGYAHPPAAVSVTFDRRSRMIEAYVVHPVTNPARHYIDRVQVSVNGEPRIVHTMHIQDDGKGQIVRYLVPDVTTGDRIEVQARCNISGIRNESVEVTE